MLKKENLVWLYFIGILVLIIIIFLIGRDYVVPFFTKGKDIEVIDNSLVFTKPPGFTIDTSKDYRARVSTSEGEFVIDLYEQNAPQNVNNFVFLAGRGYYNGTYVHRLVPGFFAQMGDRNTLNTDPADDGFGGPGYIVNDEINWDALNLTADQRQALTAGGYKSKDNIFSKPLGNFTVAMASSGADTNGSQFFITIVDGSDTRLAEMNGRFTVIGEVISGREIVSRIGSIEVDATNPLVPRPIRRVELRSVTIFQR